MSCCGGDEKVHESVKDYYGKVLSSSKDLKTSACTTSARPHPILLSAMRMVPEAVIEKYYGCGTVIPLGIYGKDVLDLGCGSGRDCYMAAVLVGAEGSVTGIDMTDEQLVVARGNIEEFRNKLGFNPKMKFIHGYIENLEEAGVGADSMDVVVSNCVLNLSPQKPKVMKEVYRVLRQGGEFYFSDVFCNRRLSEKIKSHDILLGECIGGALYVNDFIAEAKKVGFTDIRVVSASEIKVNDPQLAELVGNAQFFSITWRCFKLSSLESNCEDYGQFAIYKGTIPGYPHKYVLDQNHEFETGKPIAVCGNSAAMVGESWLKPYFTIVGDQSVHYGSWSDNHGGCGKDLKIDPSSQVGGGGCC